jgi:hypothetical protein
MAAHSFLPTMVGSATTRLVIVGCTIRRVVLNSEEEPLNAANGNNAGLPGDQPENLNGVARRYVREDHRVLSQGKKGGERR